jgi:PAS domain S-box-containing protein
MKMSRACGCCRSSSKIKAYREPTDQPIEATAEEIEVIRDQLATIEKMLSRIWGTQIYSREPKSLETRAIAADLIERHFDGIVDQWVDMVHGIMGGPDLMVVEPEVHKRVHGNMSNSLIRLVAHLRNPDDLRTYIHLRRDCQQGMLARAKPSQFNTIHIALKQVVLGHVRSTLSGEAQERVRDVVVASTDERRLMVSQFYIESRERALRDSEQKYRNTIDHAPDPMYEIEPHTWIVMGANAAAEQLHKMEAEHDGVEHGQILGRPLTDFVPAELAPGVLMGLEQVLREGSAQTPEFPVGPYFFDVNSALITYGDKQFIQMILRDVTQRREMLDSLLKAERLAAAGTFAAGVAHEVNNPLASISSLVQSLLSGESDEQRRITLHTILSQITRISGTLKDLVNFARPATAQRTDVNLNIAVSDTLRLVSYNKRFSGIQIDPMLALDLKPAFVDDKEIQQVILNLLFNAADATAAEGGVIKVVTENLRSGHGADKRNRIMIKVIDNGIGIPREHLERVFDPFFTTKPAGAGAGLGLSLCQRIILSNKGTIKVESEVGRGTAVTITLPGIDELHQQQAAQIQ